MSGKTNFNYKEMLDMLNNRFVVLEGGDSDYMRWYKRHFNDKAKLRIKKIKSIRGFL
jgi:hypothetical protein